MTTATTMIDYHSKEFLAERVKKALDRAERYTDLGWVFVKTHAPIFSSSGRVGCTCEHYKRSEHYRQWLAERGREREYNPTYICPNPGKHPAGNWKETTEVMSQRKAVALWGKPHEAIDVDTGQKVKIVWNMGVLTGPSGLLTLDADTYKEHYQCDLVDLIPLDDQETPQQFTHSGGLHLVFNREGKPYSNANGELKAAGIDGVDIRGDGGFQVTDPSVGPSGNEYAWLEGYEPWNIAPHPIPADLDRMLATAAGKRRDPAKPVSFTTPTTEKPDLAQWGLHPKIMHLLHNPPPVGQRSEADQKVITALVHHGASDDAILAFFEHYPLGTQGRFAEKGRDYLAYSIGKARAYVEENPTTNTDDGFGPTPSAAGLLSPGRRIKYPVDGVKRIVKIIGLNDALTVDGGPNVYNAEYADDDGAYWPIKVADDDDGIELMTASAPKPKAPAATVATIDDVLSAINVIASNADLKPTDRQKQIVRGLSTAIGDIDRSHHTEIVTALEQANAGFTQTAAKEFVRGCVADAKKRNKAADRVRKEAARQNLMAVRAKKGKASIDVGNRQLSDIVDEALQVLVKSNASDPTVFVRGGALARIVQDERGHYGIQEFNSGALMGKLSEVADWETVVLDDNGNPQSRAVFPPRDVVNTIIAAAGWPGIPALAGIVNAPVFSRKGELHDQPGYNAATRLYYTGGVKVGDTTPTPENIERSKDLIINNLLVDFPFKDKASLAHSIAYMIAPFVRDLVDGPTPVHTVDSPTAGTGKGKLLNACAFPFLGHDVSTMAAAKEDDEWRKRITTSLMSGSTHLVIDNVNHELDSGSLASAFTQPVWEDRTLGANREVKIPIRTIWGITANNIQMSQELARRCVWIRLDANVEKPWERSEFKHKNLIGWARANRDQLATAAITFIRAWVDQGMPLYDKRTKGSYEAWAGIIGGILEAVGIPGFLENETELYDRVVSTNDLMIDFVKAWWEKQQWLERKRQIEIVGKDEAKTEICLSSQELFKLASYSDTDTSNAFEEWQNLLGDMLTSPKQKGRQTQLGRILDTHIDKVVAGYKIKLAKTANGSKFWILQSTLVEPQTPVEPRFEVLPGSTDALPPVAEHSDTILVEPVEPNHPRNAKENIFFSCPVNDAAHNNGQEKNNFLYTAWGVEGSTGSTTVVSNGAVTGGRGLVEPQNEVLPEIEVLPASPRFKVHGGKTEAAILEAASYRCQSCETSKWSVALRLIPVAGGYNVLCEKCAVRHG